MSNLSPSDFEVGVQVQVLDYFLELHNGPRWYAHLELTAPISHMPPVLVTLLTPDGLVQASFSPSLLCCLVTICLADNVSRLVPSRSVEQDGSGHEGAQVSCRCRRLERLPVEDSMTIPSMAAPPTVHRHRRRPLSTPTRLALFARSSASLPLPWTWHAYFVQCPENVQ